MIKTKKQMYIVIASFVLILLGTTTYALFVVSEGYVGNSAYMYGPISASPAVYIDSSITIVGGTGGIGEADSYKLG